MPTKIMSKEFSTQGLHRCVLCCFACCCFHFPIFNIDASYNSGADSSGASIVNGRLVSWMDAVECTMA